MPLGMVRDYRMAQAGGLSVAEILRLPSSLRAQGQAGSRSAAETPAEVAQLVEQSLRKR